MMKKKTKLLVHAIVLTVIVIAFTVAVRYINVLPIGPAGTSVGFGKINGMIAAAIGFDENGFTYSEKLYKITDYVGWASFAWIGAFGMVGLVQLIKRKKLFEVDAEILALGAVYILTGIVYLAFEKFAVNYRPVLMPGETVPEPSFPSSHTMMSIVIWLSAATILGRYIRSKGAVTFIRVLFSLLVCAEVLGRAFSGVHWATDIIGAILFSAALLAWFAFVLYVLRRMQNMRMAKAVKTRIAANEV